MRSTLLLITLLAVGSTSGLMGAQSRAPQQHRRAKPPTFDPAKTSATFFPNLFDNLIGQRPDLKQAAERGGGGGDEAAPAPAAGSGPKWSALVSATTLEDEVKKLKLQVDADVTTPSSFAGRGHKGARRHFSLLATVFHAISQYDADVRFKSEAATARDRFARAAGNTKAGGSSNVYNEAKLRKIDLDDLVRGDGLPEAAEVAEVNWETAAVRSPLMQLLETRFEKNLKAWTSNKSDFDDNLEDILHEAELTALIGTMLAMPGMESADDEEYTAFARQLSEGALKIREAAKLGNDEMARQGASAISQSCADCHEGYR